MEADPNCGHDEGHAQPTPARRRLDIEMLCQLVDSGFEVDGEAVLTVGQRWAIFGRSTYDGELILAEYDNEDEAAAVIRSLPRR
jgi:hypothetical protein